jgi:hypothetical protein
MSKKVRVKVRSLRWLHRNHDIIVEPEALFVEMDAERATTSYNTATGVTDVVVTPESLVQFLMDQSTALEDAEQKRVEDRVRKAK